MPCAHPLPARRDADGRIELLPKQDATRPLFYDPGEVLSLPCGTCLGCQSSKAREWAYRCTLEANDHVDTCWTTLTYDDDHLPPTLSKSHLSSFLKRLRARLEPRTIRFFASGEYGERTQRPHYHVILFGIGDHAAIQSCWPHGHVRTSTLTPARIAYTAGYVAKKIGHKEFPEERLDVRTGELYQHQPPFILMSRRPGIGGSARRHHRSWRDKAIFNSAPIPVPRFLHNAWLAHATPSQITHLQEEKLSNQRHFTREQLKAAEAISRAKLQLKAETRPL